MWCVFTPSGTPGRSSGIHAGRTASRVKFDDLPAQYRGNVDTQAPFDRHAGDAPALSDADIEDIVAFLNTLTDGYDP